MATTISWSLSICKMWDKIINLALSNGIWAVLFLMLLVFQLKDSKTRENKYQQTIENLGNALQVVKEVKEDVEEIKQTLNTRRRKVKDEESIE